MAAAKGAASPVSITNTDGSIEASWAAKSAAGRGRGVAGQRASGGGDFARFIVQRHVGVVPRADVLSG
jgi:hypothetical protein